jgi:homoserine O-acetyltransferase
VEEKDAIFQQPFELESGQPLPELHIRYHTYGKLNEKRDNVIWVCHALTANSAVHDWWAGLFGAGNIFDPERYFIVCANNLGSPYGTSSPDHFHPESKDRFGMSFPEFTLRDTAIANLRLVDHLGLDTIQLLMGGSCGGNIAQEMAIIRPDLVQKMVLLCCSAQEKPWTIAVHHAQRITLKADPDFFENKRNSATLGLKAARAFALPLYRNAVSMNLRQAETDLDKLDDFKASSYVAYQGEKFVNRFDAHCYYKLLNALDTHNVGRYRGSLSEALGNIKAKTLVIGIDTDILIPITEQEFIAAHIPNGEYAEIKSIYGHDAFLIETEQIRTLIEEWES